MTVFKIQAFENTIDLACILCQMIRFSRSSVIVFKPYSKRLLSQQ